MEVFNSPNLFWRDNTEGQKHSSMFLECVNDNFPTEVTEEPTRRGVILGLVLSLGR